MATLVESWFDTIKAYAEVSGGQPTTCLVHPEFLKDFEKEVMDRKLPTEIIDLRESNGGLAYGLFCGIQFIPEGDNNQIVYDRSNRTFSMKLWRPCSPDAFEEEDDYEWM